MGWYRRVKLTLDGFHSLASRVVLQNQIFRQGSWIIQSGCCDLCSKDSNLNAISSFYSISYRLATRSDGFKRNLHSPFVSGGRRYYYVDPQNVQHFKPRGPRGWCQNPRQVFIVVVVGSGILMTVYFRNLETVPYTSITCWILIPKAMERNLGEMQFNNMKESFEGNILPPMHPESVRVKMIAKDIIHALHRGLKNEQVRNNVGYASKEVGNGNIVKAWHDEDHISYDKWVDQDKNKGQRRGSQPTTTHLNGLKWEVIVVDKPKVNAFCLPGGKIVVFTGLLQHFRSNAEIATIIGHEVAHVVARHGVDGLTKKLWLFILQFILYQSVSANIVNTMSSLLLRLPFSRRMELEADYIGILLLASAGFDPRVVPKVYEKLGRVNGELPGLMDYLSTHPSGKKRAELLAQAKVMDEALTIYKDSKAPRGVFKGFLY